MIDPRLVTTPPTVTVPVTSAWASRINWTQVIGPAVALTTYLLGVLPPEYAVYGSLGIQVVQSVYTWYLRTFQTVSVTPASVAMATVDSDTSHPPGGRWS